MPNFERLPAQAGRGGSAGKKEGGRGGSRQGGIAHPPRRRAAKFRFRLRRIRRLMLPLPRPPVRAAREC